MSLISGRHRDRNFDLFHAQYKREQILLTPSLARMAPVVWTEHGRFVRGAVGRALAAAYRRSARHVHTIICVSHGVRDDLAEICGSREPRLVVIPNPVDVHRFRPPDEEERRAARRELGIAQGARPVVAVVSRVHPAKRIDLAVEAIKRLDGPTLRVTGD